MKTMPLLVALATAGTCYAQPAAHGPRLAAGPVVARPGQPVPDYTLLRTYDLTDLLQTVSPATEEWRKLQVLNGFFGPDHYRTELVVLEVWRDTRRPGVYDVQAKSRYKNVVTPLTGTITLTQVVAQPRYTTQEIAAAPWESRQEENKRRMYTATGTFVLRSGPRGSRTEVCQGTVALDFAVGSDGKVVAGTRTTRTPTQGGIIKYAGTWTAAAGSSTPVSTLR